MIKSQFSNKGVDDHGGGGARRYKVSQKKVGPPRVAVPGAVDAGHRHGRATFLCSAVIRRGWVGSFG